MNQRDTAALVAAMGFLVAWVAHTGMALNYLRPGMVPYLKWAGIAVAIVAVVGFVVALRQERKTDADSASDHHSHHGNSRIVWMLFVPVVVAIVIAPNALGSWAVNQRQGIGWSRSESFDLGAFLRTQTIAGSTPHMEVREFVTAAELASDRPILASIDVELTGFVSHPSDAPDHVALTRFVITCCAADAVPAEVDLANAPPDLQDNTWIDAIVRLDPARSPNSGDLAVARLVSMHHVAKPSLPFESAYG